MLLVILISIFARIEGAKLSYAKQNPTSGNNNATLTCEQKLDIGHLYIQEFQLYNIGQRGSKLASVFAQTGHKLASGGVSVTSLAFTRTLASVEVAIHNASICSRGTFMCEVSYINAQFGRNSEISIIRPNSESSVLDGVHEKLDSLTSSVLSLKSSVEQLKKDVIPGRDFPQGWTLAFRGTPYINKSTFDAYKSGAGIPENVEPGCKQVDSRIPCINHYRNNDVFSKWTSITKVAVFLYERNVAVGYMLFDGRDTDYMNWYNRKNLEYSSWLDLKLSDTNIFSIEGEYTPKVNVVRRFLVNAIYNGCPLDQGWFVAIDNKATLCDWEKTNVYPMFMYAKSSTVVNWTTGKVGRADVMAIYVK